MEFDDWTTSAPFHLQPEVPSVRHIYVAHWRAKIYTAAALKHCKRASKLSANRLVDELASSVGTTFTLNSCVTLVIISLAHQLSSK